MTQRWVLDRPFRLALLYFAVGGMWILLSDRALTALFPAHVAALQSVKGLFYAFASAALFYALMKAFQRREQRALEAKRRTEERFRSLIEHTPEIVAIMDAAGEVVYRSSGYVRILGYSREDLVTKTPFGRVHPEDVPLLRRLALESPPPPGETSRAFEFRMRASDGTWRMHEGTVTNLLEDPAVRGIVINMRDVTEKKALEQQVRAAQRMETIGQLVSGIAHDFNNLLTVIDGYSEIVLLDSDDRHRESLAEIRKASERAKILIRKLLALGRREPRDSEELDVDAVLKDMRGMIRRVLPEDISLDTHLAAGDARTEMSSGELEQIVLNLVVNARDAMPEGGALAIETESVQVEVPRIIGGVILEPGAYVLMTVADDGKGMDEETLRRIFEPFFTTKARGEGTGLGLATVYGIVKEHHGYILVESEPARGSRFEIYLPALHPEGEPEGVLEERDEASVRRIS